jgi:hypothetical protein
MNEVIEQNIAVLRSYPKVHADMYRAIIVADGEGIYGLDLLAQAVLHRSLMLTSGFADLIEKHNYTCAAPLVRLQIDNALRFFASTLVDDPHDFAVRVVVKGERLDRVKDRDGKQMRDWYLKEKLAEIYPWVEDVYDETSGFVHFSHKHFYSSSRLSEDGNLQFLMPSEPHDAFVSEDDFEEAAFAFNEATKVVLRLMRDWIATKHRVADAR